MRECIPTGLGYQPANTRAWGVVIIGSSVSTLSFIYTSISLLQQICPHIQGSKAGFAKPRQCLVQLKPLWRKVTFTYNSINTGQRLVALQ